MMMFFILVVISVVLNMTFLKDLNLLMILALYAALRKNILVSFFAGLGIGFLVDIFSITTFGFNALLYASVGTLANIVRTYIYYRQNVFIDMIFTFFSVSLFYLLYFVFTGANAPSIIKAALFTSIASPVVNKICESKFFTLTA